MNFISLTIWYLEDHHKAAFGIIAVLFFIYIFMHRWEEKLKALQEEAALISTAYLSD